MKKQILFILIFFCYNLAFSQCSTFSIDSTSSTPSSCTGSSDGSASVVSIANGSGNYSYLWSTGDTTAQISSINAGIYSVIVTDNSYGCVDSTTITVFNDFSIATTSTNISCFGLSNGSATVTISGGSSSGVTSGNYCTSGPMQPNYSNIELVRLIGDNDSISNNTASTCDSYQDYTAMSTGLTAGQTYDMQINIGSCDTLWFFQDAAKVFIDWNIDDDFDDTGEEVYLLGPTQSPSVNNFTITVPTSAVAGNTRMRVVLQNYSYNGNSTAFTACDNGVWFGATEDYTLSIASGTASASYLWSTGDSTAQISNLSTGTYVVTVNTNNCSLTDSVTITSPSSITYSATTTNVSCNGGNDGTATLTLSGGTGTLTADWGIANPNALSAGTYSFTVTDSNSCTYTDRITITEPTAISAIPNITNVSCNGGSDGTVTLTLSGGTGTLTADWGTANPNALSIGSYSFTVTDSNSCTYTDSVTITQPAAIIVSATTTNVSCNGGNDGTATLILSGGTGTLTVDWGTVMPNALTAGTHTFSITDSNNCNLIDSISISEPTLLSVSYLIEGVSCYGSSDGSVMATIVGGILPYNYIWSSGGTTSMEDSLSAGTYILIVTDSNNCSITDTMFITQPAVLNSSFLQNNVSACGLYDGSIDATFSGGIQPYTFDWSNGDTTEDISNLGAGQYTLIVADSNNCSIFDTITITQTSYNLLASATTSNYNNYQISCNGGTDSVTAIVSGGSPGYSYLWSDGQTTPIANNLVAGNYTLIVTDSNSCNYTIFITLNEPPLLLNTIISTNALCNGSSDGSISVNVSGGVPNYNINWGSINNPNTLSAGNYIITTTDSNACVAIDSVEIMQPNLLSGSIMVTSNYNGENVSCYGSSDGSVMATIVGGILPYNYIWSSGGTTSMEDSLSAGTYSLIVTDSNNCVTTLNSTLTEPTALQITMTSTNVSCNGDCNGSSSANVSGGTPNYSYNWSNNDHTLFADSLCAGIHNVVVIDANGCMDFDTVNISEPNPLSISVTTDSALCYGGVGLGTVYPSGGTPSYSYLWSSGDSNQTAFLSAGNHIVLVTDSNNCFISDSLTILQADSMQISSSSIDATCFGLNNGSITLNILSGGQSPFTYSNDNGITFQTTNTFFNLGSGTYSMVMMDSNNCISSKQVTISQPFELTFTITATDATCYGYCDGTAILNISGGTPFYIENWGGLNQMALCDGLINVSVTDSNGCIATSSVTINEPAPLIVNISQNGNVLDAGPGFSSYQWLDDNLNPISGATSQQFTPTITGEYSVMVTDAEGCSATSFPIIFITNGISEITTRLQIYPNPTKDILNVHYQGFNINYIVILDMSGNIVLQKNNIKSNESNFQLSLNQLPKGIYVLQLIGEEKIINHSVILQ